MYVQSVKEKQQKKTIINSNTSYRREMKFVPINMDYCLLQFDASNFFSGIRLHGDGVYLSLIFFQCKPLNLTMKS